MCFFQAHLSPPCLSQPLWRAFCLSPSLPLCPCLISKEKRMRERMCTDFTCHSPFSVLGTDLKRKSILGGVEWQGVIDFSVQEEITTKVLHVISVEFSRSCKFYSWAQGYLQTKQVLNAKDLIFSYSSQLHIRIYSIISFMYACYVIALLLCLMEVALILVV